MGISNPFLEVYRSEGYTRPYKADLTKFPYIIDLEPTNNCNLDCIMCPRQIMTREKGKMDFELFKRIADEVSEKGGKGIRLIGIGEPLLNPNIFEMIKYTKSKGLLAHMTTNGILLNKDKMEKIFDSGLDSIIFSLQGTTKEEYTKMRNNRLYDKLEKTIKNLVKKRNKLNSKLHIQVTTTLLDETEEQKKEFYDKWEKIVDRVDNWYTTLKNIAHVERVKPLLERERSEEHAGTGKCIEVRTKLTVFWNGDVSACCGDYNGSLVLGNVKEKSLYDLWHGEKLNGIREVLSRNERHKIPLCANCNNKFLEND